MEIPFHGNYNKQTFSEALYITEKRSILSRILRHLALILAIIIIGGTIYGWVVESNMDPSKIGRAIRNLLSASLIGYFYFSGTISRNRSIAHLFRSGPTRGMHGHVNLEGIAIGTKENHVLLPWDRFIHKGEKGPLLALRMVDGTVAVFHHDFFESEMDWQRFKQVVNQKVIEPK